MQMAVIQSGHRQYDTGIDIGQGPFDGITAFQHGDVRFEQTGQFGIPACSEVHVGDGIGVVVVLAGRVDDQVGLKLFQYGQYGFLDGIEKSVFGGMRRQRNVQRGTGGIWTTGFIQKSGTRIKGAAVLVDGDEQGVRIVPVDILGAVTVVAVGVHDGYPLHTVSVAQVFDHDGLDVHIAESPGAVYHAAGMMAGRSHQGEAFVDLSLHNLHSDGFGTPGADEMGFGHHGLGIGHAEMNPLYIVYFHKVGLEFENAIDIQQALFKDLILGVEQPLFPLGMRWADSPVKGWEEDQPGFMFGS